MSYLSKYFQAIHVGVYMYMYMYMYGRTYSCIYVHVYPIIRVCPKCSYSIIILFVANVVLIFWSFPTAILVHLV